MNEKLFQLAVHLRLMNLCFHNLHQLTAGHSFFGDHKELGEFYKAMDDDYDAVVERAIGMNMPEVANLKNQLHVVEAHLQVLPEIIDFGTALALEIHLCDLCSLVDQEGSPGLKQLVGDIADRSEIRQYKIRQRIKG